MKFNYNNKEYELILLHTAGSRLYGNSTPTSDWDYRGIFIAPNEDKLGLLGDVKRIGGTDGTTGLELCKILIQNGLDLVETNDFVLYEINEFCKLALDNNPDILDTLCLDYNNKEFTAYVNEKGEKLINNKHSFLSAKMKFTFSGYAVSQLQRIKGHNKWLVQYPFINDVYKEIKEMYDNKFIDFVWICDNFSGQLAEKITGETAQDNVKLERCINWDSFKETINKGALLLGLPEIDLDRYRKPQLLDYCHPKDLKAKQLDKTKRYDICNGNYLSYFLNNEAAFRTMSPSMLTIYTEGKGIFSKEGNLKSCDPEHIGEFVCLLSINQNQYKSDCDNINKLWEWKCNRNEKRSELEEKFGYDTKHASHLARLMEGAKDVLINGTYNPSLSGSRLQLVKDVRAGSMSYDELLEYAERLDGELTELYKTTSLQKKPDVKKVNNLLLEILN